MAPAEYEFLAPILGLDERFRMHALLLPTDVADELRAAGVRRLVGTLNGHPFRLAIQGRRDGQRILVLSRSLLRSIGAGPGDMVDVALQPDPDPDRVDLGEEFEEALRQDEGAAARFFAMTPGLQRSLASYVTSAKRPETRLSRALELTTKLRTYTLYGDLHPEKR